MVSGKVMIITFTAGLTERYRYIKSYFPEPYIQSKSKIKVKVYWSNYAIKSDLKSVASIDTSHLLNKVI